MGRGESLLSLRAPSTPPKKAVFTKRRLRESNSGTGPGDAHGAKRKAREGNNSGGAGGASSGWVHRNNQSGRAAVDHWRAQAARGGARRLIAIAPVLSPPIINEHILVDTVARPELPPEATRSGCPLD